MTALRYTALLAGTLACLVLLVAMLSWIWVRQPQTGDLARIGGYVEARYESLADEPRMAFGFPLFESLPSQNSGPFDALVLGDSFSYTGGRYNWVTQFAAQSGLSIRVASIHRWRDVLETLEREGTLPPLVILQSVERDAVDHLANMNHHLKRWDTDRPPSLTSLYAPLIAPGPSQDLVRTPLPPKSFASIDERISVTVDVLWKSLRRWIGLPRNEVAVFDRDRTKPPVFSSREQSLIMAILADLKDPARSPRRWQQALSGVVRMRARLNIDAARRFVLLVIPNRLSVYAPHLLNPPAVAMNPVAERFALEAGTFNAVDLLRNSANSGVRDIYWAMDTHLSAVGAELVARGFMEWLQREGHLQRDSMIKSTATETTPWAMTR